MLNELREDVLQIPLAKEDHLVGAFVLDRLHEPLRIGVEVRAIKNECSDKIIFRGDKLISCRKRTCVNASPFFALIAQKCALARTLRVKERLAGSRSP